MLSEKELELIEVASRQGLDLESFETEEIKEIQDKLKKMIELISEAYEKVRSAIEKYMDMSTEDLDKITLWVIGIPFHKLFPSYPYLFINATKGSGKSRLLKLLAYVCRGRHVVQPTETIIFRTNDPLFFDEFEQIGKKEKKDMREFLNAAYKNGATVPRCIKVEKKDAQGNKITTFEVVNYPVYRPVAIANIWGMEDVLGDRCITIVLERSNSLKTKLIEDFENDSDLSELIEIFDKIIALTSVDSVVKILKSIYIGWNIYISTLTLNTLTTQKNLYIYKYISTLTLSTLTTSFNSFFEKINKSEIYGRDLELCFPLLLIGFFIQGTVFDKILDHLKEITSEKLEDQIIESPDIVLMDFVSKLNEEDYKEFVLISELVNRFKEFRGEEVEDWLNNRWLSRALKRLKLVKAKRRVGRGVEVILNVQHAKNQIKKFVKEQETEQENEHL